MSNQPTVFVVDDDQAMSNSLKWLIESVAMNVETYESADAFIHSYYPGRSGCLLLDVRMPGMSGLELQEYLTSHQIAIPVIIITGHADVPMAVRAMKSGAVDFIEKPPTQINTEYEPQRTSSKYHADLAEIGMRDF